MLNNAMTVAISGEIDAMRQIVFVLFKHTIQVSHFDAHAEACDYLERIATNSANNPEPGNLVALDVHAGPRTVETKAFHGTTLHEGARKQNMLPTTNTRPLLPTKITKAVTFALSSIHQALNDVLQECWPNLIEENMKPKCG